MHGGRRNHRREDIVKRLTLLVLGAVALGITAAPALAQDSLRLTGSGASFPFPIYSAWFKDFSAKPKGVTVDYQSKGSGAGIQDFINHTVDFAASDAAMTDEEMAKVPGGVAAAADDRRRDRPRLQPAGRRRRAEAAARRLSRIFLGKITKWNDPQASTAANPGVDPARLADHRGAAARTRAAPPSCSPTTSPRSARSSRRARAPAPRCSGRRATRSSAPRRTTA